MQKTKETIEQLLGEDIVSLDIQDVLDGQVVYLTYRDNIPAYAVELHVLSLHKEAEFGEIERIYSDDVVMQAYSELYGESDYERYWEDSDVGSRIDRWLERKIVTRTP